MPYTLAIDQGTHASRALLFDARGHVVASRLLPVALSRPGPGRAEQDAGEILDSVRRAVAAVLDPLAITQRAAVRHCGLATQRSTVVAWAPTGAPLAPAIGWQDTRAADHIATLQAHAGAIRHLSGLPLSPHYGASKLRWLQDSVTGTSGLRLGPLAAFLLHNLTGNAHSAVDHGNAQRMQLLDIRRRDWSGTLLDWFGVQAEQLPACVPVIHDYGTLTGHDIPVTAVCGDQNAAWFGEGTSDHDCALVNMGSGAFVLAPQSGADGPASLLTSIAASRAHGCEYLIEGTVNGAGSALQWLRDNYPGELSDTLLDEWLRQVEAPPLFINAVGGLGSPWWQHRLLPGFVPERSDLTLAQRAVAVAESILFLVQYNLDQMPQVRELRRLRVSGGLSRSEPLCRKLANLSGLPVHRVQHEEASARGVAWLAAGCPAGWKQAGHAQLFTPQPDSALRDRYQRFIEQLHQRIEAAAHD
jgi:glycerol kinase